MADDIFDSVFGALAEQVPHILSTAVTGTLNDRGLYVAQLIHDERIDIGSGQWFFTIYALQIEPPIAVAVFRFLSGQLPDNDETIFCAPPHAINKSIDIEIAKALKWARNNISYAK